jgi:hypothetical protein
MIPSSDMIWRTSESNPKLSANSQYRTPEGGGSLCRLREQKLQSYSVSLERYIKNVRGLCEAWTARDDPLLPQWLLRACTYPLFRRSDDANVIFIYENVSPILIWLQFAAAWWIWIDAVAVASTTFDPIMPNFGHWVPGIISSVGLLMFVQTEARKFPLPSAAANFFLS